jgi:hypothetical protein
VANSTDGPDQHGQTSYVGRPTPDEVIARARMIWAAICVVGIFVTCAGLGLFTIMAVPLAHAIAGKHTDFTLTLSISLSATLAATTALAGGGLAIQTRRVNRYKDRTLKLEQKLEAQGKTLSGGEGES